jgi:hypothetical protein
MIPEATGITNYVVDFAIRKTRRATVIQIMEWFKKAHAAHNKRKFDFTT